MKTIVSNNAHRGSEVDVLHLIQRGNALHDQAVFSALKGLFSGFRLLFPTRQRQPGSGLLDLIRHNR